MKRLIGLMVVVLLSSAVFAGDGMWRMMVRAMNEECPEDLGDGLIITNVAYECYVTFRLTYSEEDFLVSDIAGDEEIYQMFKKALLESFKSEKEGEESALDHFKSGGVGIMFRLVGKKSKAECNLRISAEEL